VHHRAGRGVGGRNDLSNLGLLCGSGTAGCHGWVTMHPSAAWAEGWVVKSWQNPSEIPVLLAGGQWMMFGDDGGVNPVQEGSHAV
jgi:hypothetical protein